MKWWQAMMIGALTWWLSGPYVDRFVAWAHRRRNGE